MSKPQVVTQAEIDRYRNDIETNHVAGAIRTYNALLAKGYDYAGWAKGVAEAKGINAPNGGIFSLEGSVTGRAAVLFLKESSGKNLSEGQLDKIREDMALAYLKFLEHNVRNNEVKDVDFKSMRNFHKDVFENNGLSINNWTLETPMKLIGKYEGSKAQESKWEELRKTQGTNVDALLGSAGLFGIVMRYSKGVDMYQNREGEIIDGITRMQLLMPDPYILDPREIDSDPYNVRSFNKRIPIDARDKHEAQEWIKHVSLFKPILFSQSEQLEQPRQNIGQASFDKLVEQMRAGSVDLSQLNLSQLIQDNQPQLNDLKQQSIQQAEVLNQMNQKQTMTAQTESMQNIEPETRSRGRSL